MERKSVDRRIARITSGKKRYLDLLLMGDEAETMIDRYLERGDMYVCFQGTLPVAVCVVTSEGAGLREIKNLAVRPDCRRQGYGRALLEFVERRYAGCKFQLGTGETPSVLRFYERCGYAFSHRIPHFFIDHYDHPIIEEGITLDDMLYFTKG